MSCKARSVKWDSYIKCAFILPIHIFCHDKEIEAHIPDFKAKYQSGRQKKLLKNKKVPIFSDALFIYDPEKDVYICPANKELKQIRYCSKQEVMTYSARKKICFSCDLRLQCTKSKVGRSVNRNLQQDVIDVMREKSKLFNSKNDIRTRQHLMERSFAQSKRYSFDRARWRGLTKVTIQELLICSVQNIQNLIKPRHKLKPVMAMAIKQEKHETVTHSLIKPNKNRRFFANIPKILDNFLQTKITSSPIFC